MSDEPKQTAFDRDFKRLMNDPNAAERYLAARAEIDDFDAQVCWATPYVLELLEMELFYELRDGMPSTAAEYAAVLDSVIMRMRSATGQAKGEALPKP